MIDLSSPRIRSTFKLFTLALVGLVLLIPVSMLDGLVMERVHRLHEARTEIASTWGGNQTLAGPMLVVPVVLEDRFEDRGETRVVRSESWAASLPRAMKWSGTVEPEIRRRGIFEVIVYRAGLVGRAEFSAVDPRGLDERVAEVHWSRARLAFGLGDNRGLEAGARVVVAGVPLSIAPGTAGGGGPWHRGFSVALGPVADTVADGGGFDVHVELRLRGSENLEFLPIGETTAVDLEAPWPSPSFGGAFLPTERVLSPERFTASWVVPWTARSAPQTELGQPSDFGGQLAGSGFGVRLDLPADAYQKVERSVKYGVLFLTLTFVAFLLGEVGAPRPLHPVHYGLIGAALVLFYVLLLALAEHVGFGSAYLAASAAVAGLVGAYASALLPRLRSVALAALLAGLYGYLYVTLAAEEFALLLGASGLFAALAAVMWATRRLDWSVLAPLEAGTTADEPSRIV